MKSWDPKSQFRSFGILEGKKDQDTNREDGVFAMTSHQQASIFIIFYPLTH